MKWIVKELINEYVIVDEDQPHASPVAIGMTEETATLICRAVNSHDGLLEALKEGLEWIYPMTDTLVEEKERENVIKRVQQAIAQAEE